MNKTPYVSVVMTSYNRGHCSMAGFAYYQTMNHNRAERKRLRKEELAGLM